MRDWRVAMLGLSLLATGCSGGDTAPPVANATSEPPAVATTAAPTPAVTAAPARAESRVIGKRDRTIAGGKRVCAIDFVYAGSAPEDLFWEEPCAAVTARMMDRRELEALDRWERLDPDQQRFVGRMPGGRVLYVAGTFSASVYPVDETGTSIEVAVAD